MTASTSSKFVLLLRVSTQKQGADGLGMAAQRRDVELFLQQHQDSEVVKEFVEVGSGGKELDQRPVLLQAIEHCKATSSTLLISKLCRLSRDAATVLNLMKDSTINFKVASMPTADNFALGIYAVLNQQERLQVSLRTKAALAAAKAKGVKLGNPKLAELNRTRKRQGQQFAYQHKDLVWSLHNKGRTHREICEVLNEAGMKTPKGGIFYPATVTRILRRTTDTTKVEVSL